jgi:predicted MFS family arabinose efflux permease
MKGFFKLYMDSYRGLSKATWMLTCIMLINRSGAMVIPFLGVYMMQVLHFDIKDTGTVLSCFGIGAVIGSLLGGWFTDKAGHFKVQSITLFLSVPVFCVLPALKTPLTLSAGVFILSLVTETFRPANSVAIASYARSENITKAFSLNRMAMNLGFSIGPALGGFLAAISYNWLFYGNSISVAIAGVIFFFYFNNTRQQMHEPEIEQPVTMDSASERSPWKDYTFLTFSLLCSVYCICFFQFLNTLPLFYRQVHHLNEWNIGLILAFSGLVVFSFEMLLIHIAQRRMTPAQAIILGTLLCGVAFVLLLFKGGYPLLYTGMFILCISEILAIPFMASVSMKRASKQKQGAYMGINALCFSIAHILSPFLGTRIVATFGFATLWWATGVVMVITAVGFWQVMKKM